MRTVAIAMIAGLALASACAKESGPPAITPPDATTVIPPPGPPPSSPPDAAPADAAGNARPATAPADAAPAAPPATAPKGSASKPPASTPAAGKPKPPSAGSGSAPPATTKPPATPPSTPPPASTPPPPATAQPPPPPPASGAVTPEIKTLWSKKCAGCHGSAGQADKPMSQKMAVESMATAGWQKRFSDAEIRKAITDGLKRDKDGVAQKMNGFSLTPAELDGLVALIRSFG